MYFCFTGGSRGLGCGRMLVILSSPHLLSYFVSLTDAVVTGPGLQLELKIGIILTKKYNCVSDLYVIITNSLLGQDVPSAH